MPKPKPKKVVEKTKIKKWLKDKGHSQAIVDALNMNTPNEIRAALMKIHKVRS